MTLKNINEFMIYDPARMTRQVIYKEGKSQVFILNLMPGQKVPQHNHPNAHVYLLVVTGKGKCGIEESVFDIREGDAIHCSDEQMLSLENTGENNLSLYVVLTREA